MQGTPFRLLLLVGVLWTFVLPAQATEYVFSAPPRGADESEEDVYGPIAQYLSQVLGRKVVYRHPDNWLSYQNEMQKGKYDLVFDGPHFLSWRMAKLGHEPLAKLPGKLAFAVITRKDNDRVQSLKDLAGRPVCGLAPPNLATLTMYSQFDNPTRQPLVVEVKSFKMGYQEMIAGQRCQAAVIRDAALKNLDGEKQLAKVVWQSNGVANQGFSAGPRFSAEDKEKMRAALLAPESKEKIGKFLERFNKGKELVAATRVEYEGLAVLLKDTWGFELAQTGGAKP